MHCTPFMNETACAAHKCVGGLVLLVYVALRAAAGHVNDTTSFVNQLS
jgi:poly(3-hydroxyalkanoate) synthetase